MVSIVFSSDPTGSATYLKSIAVVGTKAGKVSGIAEANEVGNISEDDREMEQHEIEFLPAPLEDAADQMVIARWMLRMIGHKHGVTITLAPKICAGHAGNGFHVHTRLLKDGKNMMIEKGQLGDTAKRAIAGYLALAPSLTALGNTVPISYLRLVPHQEAPTSICWGDRNRSVLRCGSLQHWPLLLHRYVAA